MKRITVLFIVFMLLLSGCGKPSTESGDASGAGAGCDSAVSYPAVSMPDAGECAAVKINYDFLPADAVFLNAGIDLEQIPAVKECYLRTVRAYLNYETEVPFNADLVSPSSVLNLLYFYCPVFFSDTAIDVDFGDYSTNKLHIIYTSSREEHDRIIADFEDACRPLIAGLQSATETERAIVCYYRFISGLEYDNSLVALDQSRFVPFYYSEDNLRYHDGYDAIVSKTGVCSSFAIAYSFLLSQLGIDSYTVYAYSATNGHAFDLIKLDGNFYFADPTFDADWQGKRSVSNFGVTTQNRIDLGYFPENYYMLNTNLDYDEFYEAVDRRFERLNEGAFYPEFDLASHKMTYFDTNGKRQPAFDIS